MAVFTRCTHLKVNGTRCIMDAVYGKDLCFEHESRLLRMRQRPAPSSTYNAVPVVSFVYPEDHDAILENVHCIARALGHNQIDYRAASVMDRLMNTALRTLRQASKIEKHVTPEETVRHFRIDEDGNPCATEPPVKLEPAAETGDPTILPAISAEAEEPSQPDPEQSAELRRVINSQNLSALLSTLAEGGKLERLLSNTYIFRNGKLIVAPVRNKPSRPEDSDRRATAYVFLSNMR